MGGKKGAASYILIRRVALKHRHTYFRMNRFSRHYHHRRLWSVSEECWNMAWTLQYVTFCEPSADEKC